LVALTKLEPNCKEKTEACVFAFLEQFLVENGVFYPVFIEHDIDNTQDHSTIFLLPDLLPRLDPSNSWLSTSCWYRRQKSFQLALCHTWIIQDTSSHLDMAKLVYPLIREMYDLLRRATTKELHCFSNAIFFRIDSVEIYILLPTSLEYVRTLIVCGRGPADRRGESIWSGGLTVTVKTIKKELDADDDIDHLVICPGCAERTKLDVASSWSHEQVSARALLPNPYIFCSGCAHRVDCRLLTGRSSPASENRDTEYPPCKNMGPDILSAVVLVATLHHDGKTLASIGSGVIVDATH
jgi:hypothetical protein